MIEQSFKVLPQVCHQKPNKNYSKFQPVFVLVRSGHKITAASWIHGDEQYREERDMRDNKKNTKKAEKISEFLTRLPHTAVRTSA